MIQQSTTARASMDKYCEVLGSHQAYSALEFDHLLFMWDGNSRIWRKVGGIKAASNFEFGCAA